MSRGSKNRGATGDVVFSGGQPIGTEFMDEEFYDRQYSRYDRLLDYDKRKGSLTVGNQTKYLDANQADALDKISRKLEGKWGYSVGDAIDWTLRLAVRPRANTSITSSISYGMRSFFINMNDEGAQDGLFNQLAAEGIKVFTEFVLSVLSIEVTGQDTETMVRKGFEAISNARKNGISKELLDAMDDQFDTVAEALLQEAQKTHGIFKHLKPDAVPELGNRVGRSIARKLKGLTPEQKQELIDDPVAAFDFYNTQLKVLGITLQDSTIQKLREQTSARTDFQNKMKEIEAENARLRGQAAKPPQEASAAARDGGGLNQVRKSSIMNRLFGGRQLGSG